LKILDIFTHFGKELLHKNGGLLLNKFRINALHMVHLLVELVEGFIVLYLELFAYHGDESHILKFLVEDAAVAH
jgi:hypothetical protein